MKSIKRISTIGLLFLSLIIGGCKSKTKEILVSDTFIMNHIKTNTY